MRKLAVKFFRGDSKVLPFFWRALAIGRRGPRGSRSLRSTAVAIDKVGTVLFEIIRDSWVPVFRARVFVARGPQL